MLVFEVVSFGTGIFILTGFGVGAGGPFSAIRINCSSYNSLWLKSFITVIYYCLNKEPFCICCIL